MARRRVILFDLIDGVSPLDIQVERIISPTEAVVNGRPTKLFGTNNYLGMTFDPDVMAASTRAMHESGVGTTASRVASGNLPDHCELEKEIAQFVEKRSAVVFSTGFQANLGAIAGLCTVGDVILLDEDCHASIYDAVMLSAARKIKFHHNDPEHLRTLLDGITEPKSRVLIVVESVYSASGDSAPLQAMVALKKEFGCNLLVDEAHSLGMFGRQGAGLVAELGLSADVDVITGTFSKSFGLIGGFAASDHPDFQCLRYSARAFMFTAALPPSIVAACRVSLRKIAAADGKRARLWRNSERLRNGIRALGLHIFEARSAIVSAAFDDLAACYTLWRHLLEAGFYANLLLPPATSRGACVIRFSVCSEHESEDIDALLASIGAGMELQRSDGKHKFNGHGPFTSRTGLVVPTVAKADAPRPLEAPEVR